MGYIVGAFGTSHAFAFMDPAHWDEFRDHNRALFEKRQGRGARIRHEIQQETDEALRPRIARLQQAQDRLRAMIKTSRADALVLIGDDQNEHFTSRNVPQIGLYTGADFNLAQRWSPARKRYRSGSDFALDLLMTGVEEGFDIALIGGLEGDELNSHAHAQVLNALMPDAEVPVVLVFVNAIHVPAVTPQRCYELGQLIARVVANRRVDERVLIAASGGLSHFTAGYPYKHFHGSFDYGDISVDFDRALIECMKAGEGAKLAQLSSKDLIENGDIEARAWISLLGALGSVPADFVFYDPIYRALTGIAVATWGFTRPSFGNGA